MCIDTDLLEEIHTVCRCRKKCHGITATHDERTIRDNQVPIPLDTTDKHITIQLMHRRNRLIVQQIFLRNLELHKLRMSTRKGVNLKSRRQAQQTCDLACSLQLRINDQRKSKLIPEIRKLHTVIRVPDTCDGSTVTDLFRDRTAEQI